MNIPAEIKVNGKWRPTRNSEGRLIHPTPEGLLAFWKWFGDSKVVDGNGRPLVVYHGTSRSFDAFKESRGGQLGRGIYLSPFSGETAAYGDRVASLYVSIKNPRILRRKEIPMDTTAFRNNTEFLGFDGIIITSENGILDELSAFSATQIKSATGNRGTFDPADPVMTNPRRRRNPTDYHKERRQAVKLKKTRKNPYFDPRPPQVTRVGEYIVYQLDPKSPALAFTETSWKKYKALREADLEAVRDLKIHYDSNLYHSYHNKIILEEHEAVNLYHAKVKKLIPKKNPYRRPAKYPQRPRSVPRGDGWDLVNMDEDEAVRHALQRTVDRMEEDRRKQRGSIHDALDSLERTVRRRNPAIGPDMEGFRDLVDHTRTRPWMGPFGLKIGRRDWEGDLELDIISYKQKGKKVAAVACEIDMSEQIIKEHNTYVVPSARGKGVMTSFYKQLLDLGFIIVSDTFNHSPGMRKVWLKLAKMPGITGYAVEGGQQFKDEPFDSNMLDDVLILVPWDNPSLADAALERTMEMLDWDYGGGVDEHSRPVNYGV